MIEKIYETYRDLFTQFFGRIPPKTLTPYMKKYIVTCYSLTPNWSVNDYRGYMTYVMGILKSKGEGDITVSKVFRVGWINRYKNVNHKSWLKEKIEEDNNIIKVPINKAKVGVSESYLSKQKLRFLNTPRGYLLCQTYGDLFKIDDNICNQCKYKKVCIE